MWEVVKMSRPQASGRNFFAVRSLPNGDVEHIRDEDGIAMFATADDAQTAINCRPKNTKD